MDVKRYKAGTLKGELTTSEIRKLIRAHNKASSIKISPKSTREDIIGILKKAGYSVNHEKAELRPLSKRKYHTLKVVSQKTIAEELPKPKPLTEAQKKQRQQAKQKKAGEKAFLKAVIPKPPSVSKPSKGVKVGKPPPKPKKEEPKIDKKQIDKLSLEYIKEIKKMSPLKTLAKIQSTFKKYEKKMYDFIGTNRDNYEELREYWDDNWLDKISETIPDGRKEPKKEEPKKDEKSPPPLRFSGSKSKIDKIKSKVKKGKISVDEGLKEWKIDIEAYESRRKASEKSLINKGYKSGGVDELKALEKEGIEIIKNAKKDEPKN